MMMIKPARDGLLVRKANGERLKPEGEHLPMSTWWYRRQAEGSVTATPVNDKDDAPATAESRKPKSEEK